ncbi:MAG: DNA polymerase ligase N-terminal domain-containing protein, partial [Actinomycetota bacterium]
TMDLSYAERRTLLDEMEIKGSAWQAPAFHAGAGAALVDAVRAQGLGGVLAKRLDSTYEPGQRSEAWRSVTS